MVEVNNDLVEKCQKSIKNSLQRVAKKQFKDNADEQNKFVTETYGRIQGSTDLNGVVKSTDLVVEAIIENIKIKHDLFGAIDKVSVVLLYCSEEMHRVTSFEIETNRV